jgi:hypothetical protein
VAEEEYQRQIAEITAREEEMRLAEKKRLAEEREREEIAAAQAR